MSKQLNIKWVKSLKIIGIVHSVGRVVFGQNLVKIGGTGKYRLERRVEGVG